MPNKSVWPHFLLVITQYLHYHYFFSSLFQGRIFLIDLTEISLIFPKVLEKRLAAAADPCRHAYFPI